MEKIKTHLREHFLFYTLALFVAMMGISSFYRFMIRHDYLVGYEGLCDPATQTCFVGCEDDACTADYFYSEMIKYAPDIYTECGVDITDCEDADTCLPGDRECSITYCNPDVDGDTCSTPPEEPSTPEDEQADLTTEENSLPDDNTSDIMQ
jgi:hypothetical protein